MQTAPTLFDQLQSMRTRRTDPITSRLAESLSEPGNKKLVVLVEQWVLVHGPSTGWEVADGIRAEHGDRWQSDSIRSACGHARLNQLPGGVSPGGRPCVRYIAVTTVNVEDGTL